MPDSRKRRREDTALVGSSSRGQQTKSRSHHAGNPALKKNLSAVHETSENEWSDDAMGEESQKITELAKKAVTNPKKAEGFENRFRDQVEKDKMELKKELRERVRKTAERDARHQEEIEQCIPSLPLKLQRTTDQLRPVSAPDSQPQVYSLNDIAAQMIASSQELIRDYTNLCKMLAVREQQSITKATKAWEDDKTAVAQLLESGRKLSLRRIEQLIPQEAKPGQSDVSLESLYNETSHFFPDKRDDTRLHDTFRQATKGVRRMAREIPEKE